MAGEAREELARITERLEALAAELEGDPGEEQTAELVREASKLAGEAGDAAERAVREASGVSAPE